MSLFFLYLFKIKGFCYETRIVDILVLLFAKMPLRQSSETKPSITQPEVAGWLAQQQKRFYYFSNESDYFRSGTFDSGKWMGFSLHYPNVLGPIL